MKLYKIEILVMLVVLLVVLVIHLNSVIQERNRKIRYYQQRLHSPWARKMLSLIVKEFNNPRRFIWKNNELIEFVYPILARCDTGENAMWARVRIQKIKITIAVEVSTYEVRCCQIGMITALQAEIRSRGFGSGIKTARQPRRNEIWVK